MTTDTVRALLMPDSYASSVTIPEAAERLRSAKRIAVVSHTKVDGDALGSMLALKRSLDPLGKTVDLFIMGPLEPNLMLLANDTKFARVEEQPPGDDYDLIVVVDTGAWSQLQPVEQWLKRHHERVLVIDHHSRGDTDVAPTRLVDSSMASTTQLLMRVLDEMELPLTGGPSGVAEALFIGLATDTGWFRYNNAQADVFAAAARLLDEGVDKSKLYQVIEETQRPERLAIESRALASLQYAQDGRVAIMALGQEDFEATGAAVEDLTGLVNAPLIVGEVRVSVLITQSEPGLTKISFRSKPPLPGYLSNDFVDVNKLAHRFGGGGHVHAAGARVEMDMEQARAEVIRAVESL